jgi:hypothetical protein
MTRTKLVNGIRVEFTAQEEIARDAEEAAWKAGAFDRAIARLRDERTRLLSATDFYSLSDVTMSEDMTTYRQALRDLPSGLSTVEDVNNVTYPTKPE